MTKRMRDLQEQLNTLDKEIGALLDDKKVSEAKAKMEELNDVKDAIEIEASLADNNRQIDPQANPVKNKKDDKKEAFAKYVRREDLTPEEKNLLVSEVKNGMSEGSKLDGGALVPFDEDTSIIALREAGDALQNLVTVMPVKTLAGKKTVRKRRSGGTNFNKVGEGQPIGKGTNPQYVELEYNCDKYAAIYDITNELLDDSTENVIGELNEWIGHDSRECRNSLILSQLATKTERVAITGFDDIKDILNTKLNTANAQYSSIITNQDGYNFLDKIKDSNGNYILQPIVGETDKFMVKGKRLHVYDNTILPTTANKIPMIIGDIEMAVVLFDRQTVAVKVTTEGGDAFDNDLTLLRAIEREDIQTLDDEAYVYGEITVEAQSTRTKK